MPILAIENLSISFQRETIGGKQQKVEVISNLEMEVEKGEILAVVGASGSGKSLVAHGIMGILPVAAHISGRINYKGERLTKARQKKLRGSEIALIPQSVNFLNPLIKVGKQVRTSNNKEEILKQREIFAQLGLAKSVEKLYPFQLSGGMARRVLLATAILTKAELIIADEPTPGLDKVAMKESLSHLRRLADQGSAIIMITHDIQSALTIADKIAVFYAGSTIEIANKSDFTGTGEALRHPYTKALWRALPQNDFLPVASSQPKSSSLTTGCLFSGRCELATVACVKKQPRMKPLQEGLVRCTYAT